MVSFSTGITLGLIGVALLGFYKLGGASGIGSRLGGGFSSLFDSFGSSLNPVQAAIGKYTENPALNPLLVAQARYEEATTLDPNLDPGRFVDPAGKYDPFLPYGPSEALLPTVKLPKSVAPATITPPPFIQYGDPLPPFAGDLQYVVNTNFPNARKATAQEKSYLQSFGIGL